MRILLTTLLIFLSVSSFTENVFLIDEEKVDSLETRLILVSGDDKLELLLKLCQELVEKDSEKCMLYAQQALELSQKLNCSKDEVQSLIYLARNNSNNGNYFEGLQLAKKALEVAENEGLDRGVVDAWNEIGVIYFNIGSYEEAQAYYFKSLNKAEEIGYKEKFVDTHANIAIIYAIFKDYEKALEWFNRLIVSYKKENDDLHLAKTLVNIAIIYTETGEYEKAFQFLKRAIPIFEESQSKIFLSSTLIQLGDIQERLNDLKGAFASYERAMKIAGDSNYQKGIVSSSFLIGNFYANQDQFRKALIYYEKSLKIALAGNLKAHIADGYKALAQVSSLLGDYKSGLENTQLYIVYRDSIYNEQAQKQIKELQIKYETEKKEEEIELLQIRMRTQRRNQIILIVGLLIISFLVLRVLHLKQVNLKRKNLLLEQVSLMDKLALEKMDSEKREKDLDNLRLQEEMLANEEINRLKQLKYREDLKHKERELAANALHVVSKNETLDSLKKSVEAVLASDKGEIQRALKRLIQEIDGNINLDQDWEMFKMHFEEVHQGFFKRLVEKYTDLNTNDLRFCAYLRLNLDAKEIARILNISVNAIEKRRYRLRKKLGLDSSDNLFEFLSNF